MKRLDEKRASVHILIVDDEAPIRKSLKSVLSVEGYMIECAVDGIDCLQMAKEKIYDLIFLDIRMPKMNGIEVLKHLVEKNYPGHIDMYYPAMTRIIFRCYSNGYFLNRIIIAGENGRTPLLH